MLLGTLRASSIKNLLTDKEMKARMPEPKVIRLGEGILEQGNTFNDCSKFKYF